MPGVKKEQLKEIVTQERARNMNCNLKECYWNMWSPKHEMFNNEQSKQCVSEDLSEHFSEETDFQLTPNNKDCPSYRPYISFCGKNKGD